MILFISDTHCYYHIINEQIAYAEQELGVDVSCVVHLGDFGIYRPNLHDYFVRKKQRFLRPLYFIEGNHEDFVSFTWLVKKYQAHFVHLPRAAVTEIDGFRMLSLGGSAYMDAMNTQQGAVITDQQIDACLSVDPASVDLVITHDCPVGIGVPNTPGLECFGETGFPRSDEIAAHFKPKLWVFGHHHKWFEARTAHTAYYGLNGSWKGFGLLDTDGGFRVVEHRVPWGKTPLVERILMRLKIIRPDSPPTAKKKN